MWFCTGVFSIGLLLAGWLWNRRNQGSTLRQNSHQLNDVVSSPVYEKVKAERHQRKKMKANRTNRVVRSTHPRAASRGDVPRGKKNISLSRLAAACLAGELDMVLAHVSRDSVNTPIDDRFDTLLHAACRGGNANVVAALLDADADLGILDMCGNSALHAAVGHSALQGQTDTVRTLISAGASVNAVNMAERTPLFVAVERNNLELVRLLIDARADVNAAEAPGSIALHHAVDLLSPEVTCCLLEAGANVNTPGFARNTPLHLAVKNEARGQVLALLDGGADPNLPCELGITPAQLMAQGVLSDVLGDTIFLGTKSASKCSL
mmetsp:Transcript_12744/g.29349  ORF Transcript_12744/g.29349 Transcript_12744/m.29349 type:complete len:322 (+) Transcript_12744:70-1035(+)|eukprot:CAMPEP_0114558578 /NCGR_PEP_ID=MMETSP0114-20121206/10460_1 /TAXON_ID=31324 /ORGANISM="Goniomonas sp, Strain m" /LENGTH=321 /DNA_ID=CAMNT_0001743985 /DNA_START=48 /DNA_END=1013 /DNA_ORIENTATION=-